MGILIEYGLARDRMLRDCSWLDIRCRIQSLKGLNSCCKALRSASTRVGNFSEDSVGWSWAFDVTLMGLGYLLSILNKRASIQVIIMDYSSVV